VFDPGKFSMGQMTVKREASTMSALIESVRFVHGVRTGHQSPCIVRASSQPHSSITHKVADRIRVRAYAHTRSRLVDPSIPMINYSLLPSSSDHRTSPGATIHFMHPVRLGCTATQVSNRPHRWYNRRSAIDHVGQRARNPLPSTSTSYNSMVS
jgi:hypothetical protein